MATVKADDNNGNGGQRQWQRRTRTAVDDDGTRDRVKDYEGKEESGWQTTTASESARWAESVIK
jgi:hypothetical protein